MMRRLEVAGIVLLILACIAGIVALSGCGRSLVESLGSPMPPLSAATPAAGESTGAPAEAPAATSTLDDLRAAVDRTAGLYAQAKAALDSRERAVRAEEQAKRDKAQRDEQAARDKAQRDTLAWAERIGYVAALLGIVAWGITFSPWASWIPGGRVTAGIVIVAGVAVSQVARVLAALLTLTWLVWVLAAVGATAAAAWIVWVIVRETAAHGDRIEPAVTPDQVAAAKAASAAAQTRAGVRGLIRLARCRLKPSPLGAP
jgi:hypothetical protein